MTRNRRGARSDLSRRRFLAGVGGVTLGLPALSMFQRNAWAQGMAVPKRLIIMFSPNGTLREEWVGNSDENNFTLGPILQPLADFRDDLLILRGLDSDVAHSGGPGDGHQTGMGCMLTGRKLLSGNSKGGCGGCAAAGLASGISIDQHIANQLGGATAFPSLELGVQTPNGVNAWTRMSYAGRDDALSPVNDPEVVWDRIAGRVDQQQMDSSVARRLEAKRRSSYEAVKAELASLRSYAPSDDRAKIDRHVDFIDGLESRIESLGGGSCSLPDSLRDQAYMANDNFPAVGKAHMDIAVHALSCNLTQVVTLQWDKSVGQKVHTWAGVNRGHHSLSHEVDSRGDSYQEILKIDRWYASQFAYLIGSLKNQTAEDGQSLLHHTAVLWVNELARGSSHSRRNQSWLLAGQLGGTLSTGRHIDVGGRSNNDLFVTLGQSMGVEMNSFGEQQFNNGPLTELLSS